MKVLPQVCPAIFNCFPDVANSISNVVLIGAGQLGSRHLQGLTRINCKIRLTVIDPSPDALAIAKERYNEMLSNPLIKLVSYQKSNDRFKDDVDLAIIATNADVRREVIETLIYHTRVRFLILEKVAFQSVTDFKEVSALLAEKSIKAWVNCTRRMVFFFQELKKRTILSSKVILVMEGSNWGLASNAIHMLDLLAFLTDQTMFQIDASNLKPQVYESKRKGFIELGGELRGESQRGDCLTLIDRRDAKMPLQMWICFSGVVIKIDQAKGLALEYPENRREQVKEQSFHFPQQSELTSIQAQEILQTGNSQLTTIEESYLLHKPMLEAFNRHVHGIQNEQVQGVCPIT